MAGGRKSSLNYHKQILKIQSQIKKRPEGTQSSLPQNISGQTNGAVGWLPFILKNARRKTAGPVLCVLHSRTSERGEPPWVAPGTRCPAVRRASDATGLPSTATGKQTSSPEPVPPKPHSRLLCPSPVIPHRADPSYATGLQPPSPEKPSVAVALLAVFAFFPIVTEPRARRPSVQTIAIVPLPILAPFHQCFCQLAMSGQSTPVVNPPSVLASLR